MLGDVVEGLAWIDPGGGGEPGSRTMGSRWWWPWGSFGQSGSRKMMAGGGDEMVVDDGAVDGLMVDGALLSLSAGERSTHVVKGGGGGGGRW